MTWFIRLAAAALVAVAPGAAIAQTPALEAGSYLIGGSAAASLRDGAADNVFSIGVVPRVEYFVANGLSFGGQLGGSYVRQGEASSTSLLFGPALSYYFVRDGRAHPFLRASASYRRASFESPLTEGEDDSWELTGALGVLYMLSDAVGLDAQLAVTRSFAEAGLPGDEVDVTTGALRLGIAAFLF